ncbi:MAG: hypothetical protein ACRDH5_18725 [bacterium]
MAEREPRRLPLVSIDGLAAPYLDDPSLELTFGPSPTAGRSSGVSARRCHR